MRAVTLGGHRGGRIIGGQVRNCPVPITYSSSIIILAKEGLRRSICAVGRRRAALSRPVPATVERDYRGVRCGLRYAAPGGGLGNCFAFERVREGYVLSGV